jgi:hypothetical protein
MVWRKWIVRGVVYGIIGAAAAAALGYQRWTNPGAVRDQVIDKISEVFPGAQVSVDSARLRILGGIQLDGLRLSRRDDPEKHEFLNVPSAIFYHDKQKILDGQLALLKIELIRPRLRIRRERDGTWNLHGLLRTPGSAPDTAKPALVIHQGTLILEDHLDPDKATTLEINDVNLTVINDPLPCVTIKGGGNSDLLGKLSLQGALDRTTGEAHLAFRASEIPLTQNLVARLPVQCPSDIFVGLQLSATASIEGKASYHPRQPQPFYYDVRCEIKNGKLQHPKLPLALENLHVKFRAANGELHLEKLTARSGATEIAAHGVSQLPACQQEFEVDLELRHVLLGKEFSDRLPAKLRDLHELFKPRGPTTIHVACARHEGQFVTLSSGKPSRISIQPESISLAFKNFPYPLQRAVGAVHYDLLSRRVDIDLTAYASEKAVFLFGHWTGEGADADVSLDLRADDVPVNERLLSALPTAPINLQRFVESFHAVGKFDVKANISHKPGKDWQNEYHIRVRDTAVQWDNFPVRVTNVGGFIDVYPDHWEFHQFHGAHNGGQILIHGKSIPKIDAKGEKSHGISLEITGQDVPLGDDMRDALRDAQPSMPGLYKAWETFKPQGKLNFTAAVNRPTADVRDLDVNVKADGGSAQPTFFPYRFDDIHGQFRFHNYSLAIAQFRAKHNETSIALERGTVDLDTRGGYYADLADVQLGAFRLDDDFVRALPPGKLPTTVKSLQLHDPLKIATRLVIAQAPETGKAPDIFWEGKAWMYGANVTAGLDFKNVTAELACLGRYNGQIVGVDGNLRAEQALLYNQPFKKVHAKFQMRDASPDVLLVNLRAPIFNGDVVGQMRVDFNSALRYEMNMTFSQINLAEFARHNLGPHSEISGVGNARIFLRGMGNDIETLDGNGAIDIPRGHLYNLPFLLDLLRFLGTHGADRTAFEEFHATFGVLGKKVNVQKVELLGSTVSLCGKGEFDLGSKKLQLDIYPMWGRIEQLLPPQIRPLPTNFSKNLLIVEVRGTTTGDTKDLKYTMKPVPAIVDPLLLLRDRVMGTPNANAPEFRPPGIDLSLPPAPENDRR